MSRTLNLIDILLTTGRQLFLMGRCIEALVPLTKLAGFRNLPKPAFEDLQALLAEVHLQLQNHKNARRHLTAAIALKPLKAEYYYLMAIAIEEDTDADLARAEMYYSRAVQLAPELAHYWCDYGAYLMRIEKKKEGLKAIRKAYALAITDPEIVGRIAEVLRQENLMDEATTKLRAALFHNHGVAAFKQLWQQHQFARIHADQQEAKTAPVNAEESPIFLPFVRPETTGKFVELGEKTIRIDKPEKVNEPKTKQPIPFKRPPRKG
ncbi:MAG: hypothetical protein HYX68_21665 [Planctomycetes bacterium]|nr:hypothetical protein [Planctomycetota bacterium]